MVILSKFYFRVLKVPYFYVMALLAALVLTLYGYMNNMETLQTIARGMTYVFFANYCIAYLLKDMHVESIKKNTNNDVIKVPSTLVQMAFTFCYLVMGLVFMAYYETVPGLLCFSMIFLDMFTFKLYTTLFAKAGCTIQQSFWPQIDPQHA